MRRTARWPFPFADTFLMDAEHLRLRLVMVADILKNNQELPKKPCNKTENLLKYATYGNHNLHHPRDVGV